MVIGRAELPGCPSRARGACASACIPDVAREHPPQSGLVRDDHVIQAFPPDPTDDALDVGVLPWRRGAMRTVWMFMPAAVVAAAVNAQSGSCRNSPALVLWKAFRSCWAVQAAVGWSVTASHDASPIVREDDEDEQQPEGESVRRRDRRP